MINMFTSISYILMLVALCIFADLKFFRFASASRVTGPDILATEIATRTDKIPKRRRATIVTYASRSAQKAARVVDNVLSDAAHLPKKSRCCDDFQKFGGYRDAVRDFNNLELEDVTRFMLPRGVMGKAGEIGDRTVFVRSAGLDGRPVLEIIRRKQYMEMKDDLDWLSEPPIIRIFYSKTAAEK